MIEANELRIGNLLMDAKGRICKVEKISEDGWTAYAIKGAITSGTPIPIELTEEILLKCGFKLANTKTRCYQKPNSQTLYFSDEGASMSTGMPMKYLHELQNRIKSMTGKELEIEL